MVGLKYRPVCDYRQANVAPLYFVLTRLASKHTTVKRGGLGLNEIWRFQSKGRVNFPFYLLGGLNVLM